MTDNRVAPEPSRDVGMVRSESRVLVVGPFPPCRIASRDLQAAGQMDSQSATSAPVL